jgi:hypothetical protein
MIGKVVLVANERTNGVAVFLVALATLFSKLAPTRQDAT